MESVFVENFEDMYLDKVDELEDLQERYDELERLFVNHNSEIMEGRLSLDVAERKNDILTNAFELLANPDNYREKYEEPMFKDDTIYLFEFARQVLNEVEKVE